MAELEGNCPESDIITQVDSIVLPTIAADSVAQPTK